MATADRTKGGFVERLKRPFVKLWDFLHDVWLEMHKVKWPSHQETYAFTVVVIIAVVIVSVWVGFWDAIFTWLISSLQSL
ncbi:MAG TPA: preprotein translocase subunit SecE [Armatimonadetes bacterium]|jgi:preprotein translocase subunit SecE|nr:preprotein translocase subunit SecE [Armatimonadota bacterium]